MFDGQVDGVWEFYSKYALALVRMSIHGALSSLSDPRAGLLIDRYMSASPTVGLRFYEPILFNDLYDPFIEMLKSSEYQITYSQVEVQLQLDGIRGETDEELRAKYPLGDISRRYLLSYGVIN